MAELPDPPFRVARTSEGWKVRPGSEDGYRGSFDERGRAKVTLGRSHPYANAGGWQWLSRFLVMEELGRVLAPSEHVHHKNGNRLDDDLGNYEVLEAEYHGSLHASQSLTHARDPETGRFVALEEPVGPEMVPRWRWLVGRPAEEMLCD